MGPVRLLALRSSWVSAVKSPTGEVIRDGAGEIVGAQVQNLQGGQAGEGRDGVAELVGAQVQVDERGQIALLRSGMEPVRLLLRSGPGG